MNHAMNIILNDKYMEVKMKAKKPDKAVLTWREMPNLILHCEECCHDTEVLFSYLVITMNFEEGILTMEMPCPRCGHYNNMSFLANK